MNNEKIYTMSFRKVYPFLVNKALRKGRTLDGVVEVITWLTGYTKEAIDITLQSSLSYGDFFGIHLV